MFRILAIFVSAFFLLYVPALARTAVNEGCFTDCSYVDNTHLVCAASDCDTTGWHQFGLKENNTFFDRLYEDSCRYYDGNVWVPCIKKMYDGTAWISTDAGAVTPYLLEAVYMLLMDVMPARPAFVNSNFANAASLPTDIDVTAVVSCDDTTVERIYENYTAGTINAYPVALRCNTASTWSGARVFFISPGSARGMLATMMIALHQPGNKIEIELTSFAEYSFVTSLIIGTTL